VTLSAASAPASAPASASPSASPETAAAPSPEPAAATPAADVTEPAASVTSGAAVADLVIVPDLQPSLAHGPKPAANQKYIVLHDTEGTADPASVIAWWAGNGNLVASHYVIGVDGSVYQAVPVDEIAHHAGYGDAGHNELFGVTEDGRDDMAGSVPIGDWAPDYGMNAWSVGIELVHVGGSGDYPEAQLDALDQLIAYLDGYFGFPSAIIDHKAWRSGNSDTSPEFAGYLANYQDHRTHG
jgi:N-acetyl-anhydromuramyl-L-alanine amidase AmpD